MFGISGGEIMIILVLALIMIKPEDLPAFVRKLGQTVGMLQEAYRSLQVKGQTFKHQLENMAPLPAMSETSAEPTARTVLPALPGTVPASEPEVIVVPVVRETETGQSHAPVESVK